MDEPNVVIHIEGGIVQAVYSGICDLKVEIMDTDCIENLDEDEPDMKHINWLRGIIEEKMRLGAWTQLL